MSIVIPQPSDKISKYFTYKEALWLPQWKRMATEDDGVTQQTLDNLKALFLKMDILRDWLKAPINVHVAFRSDEYNKLVGGAPDSAHRAAAPNVAAVDFDVGGKKCDDIRTTILNNNKLTELGLRMEDLPGSNWVHLDTRPPIIANHRFFKP